MAGLEAAVVGVDLGTQSAKAVAFDLGGRALAEAVSPYPLEETVPERAEQRPDLLVAGAAHAVKAVADQVGGQVEVAALACSGALHTLLGLGTGGGPVTPVLTWADSRAADQAVALATLADGPDLAARTGTPLHPMSPLAKLRWFGEHDTATFAAVERWVAAKDYLIATWTGELVTDHSTASATGLYALETGRWDDEALRIAGIDTGQLPAIIDTTATAGHLSGDWAERLGLDAGLPVVVGAGDGPLANLGSGAITSGVAALSIGTSGAVRVAVDRPHEDARHGVFCYALGPALWIAGGPLNNGGLVLRWLRDEVLTSLAEDAREDGREPYGFFDELAAGVPPGSDGLLFVPSLTGERAPSWDPDARGAWIGLDRAHGRAELIRSAMEGVMYQVAAVVATLEAAGLGAERLVASGGFTASALWCQIAADVLGRELAVPDVGESSCRGAALLAMHGLGLADGFALSRDATPIDRTHHPDPASSARYAELTRLFTGAQADLTTTFSALARLRDRPPPSPAR